MMAASTPGCDKLSPRFVVQCGILRAFATSRVESGLPPQRLTTSMPEILPTASRCFCPNAPWPTIAIFIWDEIFERSRLAVFQDDETGGGVGRRHVVVPVNFLHLVVQGSTHDQPHDEFDPFGAGVAHVVDMRKFQEL